MDRLEGRRERERVRSEFVSDLPQYLLRKPFFYLVKFLLLVCGALSWFFGFKFDYELEELERYVWLKNVDVPSVKLERNKDQLD